jgi:hypothetical protein
MFRFWRRPKHLQNRSTSVGVEFDHCGLDRHPSLLILLKRSAPRHLLSCRTIHVDASKRQVEYQKTLLKFVAAFRRTCQWRHIELKAQPAGEELWVDKELNHSIGEESAKISRRLHCLANKKPNALLPHQGQGLYRLWVCRHGNIGEVHAAPLGCLRLCNSYSRPSSRNGHTNIAVCR